VILWSVVGWFLDALEEANADPDGEWYAALARVEAELSRLREERDDAVRVYDAALRREEAAEARCARLQQALEQARACIIVDFYGGSRSRAVQVIDEALAGSDTPADSFVQGANVGPMQNGVNQAGDPAVRRPADSQEDKT